MGILYFPNGERTTDVAIRLALPLVRVKDAGWTLWIRTAGNSQRRNGTTA